MKTFSAAALRRSAGFNLIELLVVIVIIATLTSIAIPGFAKIIDSARTAKDVSNLRGLVNATFKFASDNNEKLPSPRYTPGAKGLPEHWDAAETGTGLWLDGTVFHAVYPDVEPGDDARATSGDHLVGTIFESEASVKSNTEERDWYRHSYAMNANLQYDRIHEDGAADKWLTEKTYGNLNALNSAMLFIDCADQNVVMQADVASIIETGENRRQDYVIAAYLDGHVDRLRFAQPSGSGFLPTGDIETDPDASAFWRGMREER